MKKQNSSNVGTTDDHHSSKLPKEYFVTQTLSQHLEAFAGIDLKVPDDKLVQEVEDGLVAELSAAFPTDAVKVTAIPVREQCHAITSSVSRIRKRLHNPLVLSTCPLLSFGADGRLLHLSRLIDFEGNIIGIGPRPCHDIPSQQLSDIHSEISEREIILVEDGSFTGSTLVYTLELLKKHRARVEAIVLGILFPEAEQKIRTVFDGELVSCEKPQNPLDWMPSHDFFPFVPNAGRVIGCKVGSVLMPVYLNYDNAALAVPYVRPYGNPDWASLPKDQHALNRFSVFCLHSAVDLFKDMERKRGETILVKNLMGSKPVTYIPVNCGGQFGFARDTDEVVYTIQLDLEMLS